MPTTPDDIVNEALDEIGAGAIDGMQSGGHVALTALRVYDTLLRGLHAAAPWNFARRQGFLVMAGDTSGQYNDNRDIVPVPWSYVYEWPLDCVHFRFVVPLRAYAIDANGKVMHAPYTGGVPAPFLVTTVPLINELASSWDTSEGRSPEETRVICTNELGALGVWTGLVQYPDAWDPLFRRAFVCQLAARLAMSAVEDKKLALALRAEQLRVAEEALAEARVRDGNEGWTTIDSMPDWIAARTWCGVPPFGRGSPY